MGGVGRGSSVGSLLCTVTTGTGGERLSAGPASGEERNGFVLATLPSADFRRRAFVVGGMSSGPKKLLVSISIVFGVPCCYLLSTVDRRHVSILAWKKLIAVVASYQSAHRRL